MSEVNNEINNNIIIENNIIKSKYKFFPKNKKELQLIINNQIKKYGNNCDLNNIDTTQITDMSLLFETSKFNGNISEWDVSNVTDMNSMFEFSEFNRDISKWNVSNVTNMS